MSDLTVDSRPRAPRAPRFERMMDKLAPELRESLSETQRRALREAFSSATWRRQPVDIRLSLPLFASRYFVAIVAGREKRPRARRRAERVFHPLSTIGNSLFIGAIASVLGTVVLVAVLVYSSILSP